MNAPTLLDDADERLIAVRLTIQRPDRLLVERFPQEAVTGGEDAAHHLDRGGGKVNFPGAKLLLYLGHVSVPSRLVGPDRPAALRMMTRRGCGDARFARPGLHLDDRALDQTPLVQRVERQDGRGGVKPINGTAEAGSSAAETPSLPAWKKFL